MTDQLYRGIIDSLDVRFVLVDCRDAVQEIIIRHNCDPISAHLLSRAVGATTLVSALLTEDEKYTLRWNYQGKLQTIIADCNAEAHVRAFIAPTDLASYVQNEGDIYGQSGTITVIKSSALKTLNSGSTEAGLLDVVEDLAFHFSFSDQIETAMSVLTGFNPDPERPVKSCRAVMLQALPDCDLERFDRIRLKLATPECRALLASEIVQDNLFERIAMELTKGETDNHNFTLERNAFPKFHCTCSKKTMAAALTTMPQNEIDDILEKEGHVTMTCRFCNTTHHIAREDLA